MAPYFSARKQLNRIHVKVCFARKNDVIEPVIEFGTENTECGKFPPSEEHSWPGVGKHFGIYACDHVIDVISANDPVIEKIFARLEELHMSQKE